ncbi:sugar phosphate isomerase/epimerase [Streptomyces sp. NBC_00723]
MSVRLGYGTNGLSDLRLDDALGVLAELGYDGVGLTLDHMHLDPVGPGLAGRVARVAERLGALGLSVTVETGARYVLDPRRKHGPTLLDAEPEGRAARSALLVTAVQVAADLGAHAVHCFSGVRPAGTDEDAAWELLGASLTPVLDAAEQAGVPLAIEPEPGHLLETLAGFHRLRGQLDDHPLLGLTLDIGHCQCLEPLPPADCVTAAGPWLRHVQIEDMRRGVHEHLPFGEGEIDFPPVLAALDATGYQGLTVVELPRHSHAGPELARSSMAFLRTRLTALENQPPAGPTPTGPTPAAPFADNAAPALAAVGPTLFIHNAVDRISAEPPGTSTALPGPSSAPPGPSAASPGARVASPGVSAERPAAGLDAVPGPACAALPTVSPPPSA